MGYGGGERWIVGILCVAAAGSRPQRSRPCSLQNQSQPEFHFLASSIYQPPVLSSCNFILTSPGINYVHLPVDKLYVLLCEI